jgi:heavy metal efflux system protein
LTSTIYDLFTKKTISVIIFVTILAVGLYSIYKLNIEAFPDVSNVQVQINTEAPGLAALEVERLITFPIESVMNGITGVTNIRSTSKTGLSSVTVTFKDNMDIYFVRQLVFERIQLAKKRIPDSYGSPEMGPITTGLGQIFKYILKSDNKSIMELRTINDWVVKFQLRTVPGVTDILSLGGAVRQYQINIDPNNLYKYQLTLSDVENAIQQNNTNAGGWYIEKEDEQFVVRGEGLIRGKKDGLVDIENIVLKSFDGTPIYIKNIATVEYGSEIRQGAVTMNSDGEVVMGIVLQLQGANTKKVIINVKEKMDEIQKTLPEGVSIVPVYDQEILINKAISTVVSALGEASVLIVIILLIFLGNFRASLIVVLSIPLSLAIAFTLMKHYGLSANLQSLGGLAIAIGMIVDGSVVVVENIMQRLSNNTKYSLIEIVKIATFEVARPVTFAILIISVVFLPLFTMEGVEYKLFSPIAFTIIFAMMGSLFVALIIVPGLSTIFFKPNMVEKETRIMHFLQTKYRSILEWSFSQFKLILASIAILFFVSVYCLVNLGTEFVPELNEGTMTVRITMNPSISLDKAMEIGTVLEKKLIKYPEVLYAFSQIGRPELGGDPEPISNNEIFIGLKDLSSDSSLRNRESLIEVFEKDLGEYPGIKLNFSQPIKTRVDELLSGIKAQLAIKLFGEDLEILEEKGEQIENTIKNIPGATDVQLEQISGETQLIIKPYRDVAARYGVNVADIMEIVSSAIGGKAISQVIEEQKRFDIYMRVKQEYRKDIESISNLWVTNKEGHKFPLSLFADLRIEDGRPMIKRENAQRRIVIACNIRGTDMGGFVEQAKAAIANTVSLPAGYYLSWGGQFENQIRAQKTLSIVIPICLGLIFMLLYMSFQSVKDALIIILNVPFALLGGIIALYIANLNLSVPSSVGFITLFGVAVLNGVVMVSFFRQLGAQSISHHEAIVQAAVMRLRPVLITALIMAFSLIPLLFSSGIGSEIQRPLATVVVGGLLSSTILTLLILPVIYKKYGMTKLRELP